MTVEDLVFLRCAVGGLILLPYLLIHLRDIPPKLLAIGFGLAFLQGWGTHLTTIIGLQFAPASHASALGPGFIAVWVALWGWLFYRLRPSRPQLGGLALIFLGAMVLLLNVIGPSWNLRMAIGDAFFLAASSFGAVYLVYIQRHNIQPMVGAAMVSVFSGVIAVPWFFLSSATSRLTEAPLRELLLHLFYQGFAVGAAFVALIGYAVRYLGGQRFSIIISCVPVLSLAFGRWIAGDPIQLFECVAIGLISTGILYGAFSGGAK